METPLFLIPLVGDDKTRLHQALDTLEQEIQTPASLSTVARQGFKRAQQLPQARYALSIMGSSLEELLQEIAAARTGFEKAFEKGEEWISPRGSYFTARPLAGKGKIAFVYPGGLNSYVGMARHFFQLFPQMYDEAKAYSSRLERMVGDRLIYPRSFRALSKADLAGCEKDLFADQITMYESGIMFGLLYTKVFREGFHIEPDMALGYSMGEVSMWYALGVWDKTDKMSDVLRSSPLYRTRTVGPMETVREAWNLPPAEGEEEKIWYCHTLRTSAAKAREALEGEGRAFLTFINSPNEVIIAGEGEACERVIDRLGCSQVEVPVSNVVHCELAKADHEELVRVHTLAIKNVPAIDFYSAHTFAPLSVSTENIADNIASIYTHEIDFVRLIQQAYEDGARIFLELGPRANCTNWIGEILETKDHLAVAANRKGTDDKATLLRALAKLYSHRVALDLSPLYPQPEASPDKSLVRPVSLGGLRIGSALLTEENRKRFKPSAQGAVALPASQPAQVAPRPPTPPVKVQATPQPATVVPVRPETLEDEQDTMKEPALVKTPSAPRDLSDSPRLDQNLSLLSSAHSSFLEARREGLKQMAEMIQIQMTLASQAGAAPPSSNTAPLPKPPALPRNLPATTQAAPPIAPDISVELPFPTLPPTMPPSEIEGTLTLAELLHRYPPREKGPRDRVKPPGEVYDYWDLREFAEGDIGKVFGKEYAIIDNYTRRVRLPLEPYLLVSRVTKIEAETNVFKPSMMITEYDIPYSAWYSIDGQIPWAVAVESGQCDLWLISYLGIDFQAKGNRVYRLLDCTLTFMENAPQEGDTLRYEIRINSFAKTGGPLLFFFEYDCYVKDTLVIEMRGGCAGFFTDEELEAGKGIIRTDEEIAQRKNIQRRHFDPLLACEKTTFDREDLVELIHNNDAACFGPQYDRKGRNPHLHLTAEPMLMMDRITHVDPHGGAWGLGLILAEKDMAPDHWYFPCHFKDDQVLAGSLQAEGCGQLMRFFMLYIGLQSCTRNAVFQPIPRLGQKVRCRGQVIPDDALLVYRMEIKEIVAGPEPYAIADVDILLGDKTVVDFKDLGIILAEKDEALKQPPQQETGEIQSSNEPTVRERDKNALFTKYHLVEFATGRIANCFGEEFAFYDNRQPPRTPNGDMQLISRVLETKGTRMDFKNPSSVVAEYDVPEDMWFFRQSSYPSLIPYSMLMEIALQPNGFISAWTGTTLISPDTDFCFRNLDGEGTILRPIDLRGKTITNRSELLSTVTTGNTMIQQFRWELSHDGEPFFVGTAVFGYFLPEALAHQIGLDRGVSNSPLDTQEHLKDQPVLHIDLKSSKARQQLYEAKPDKPYYHLAGPQLDFLDEVHIVEQGGEQQQGYVLGYKKIDPTDWFYPCHFYQDPVMPGSLGVEAILQAMQIFALQQDLGAQFQSPRFAQLLNHKILWKYRGQLTPVDDRMVIGVHIKRIERTPERVTVFADAGLWKNEIRIYQITDAAVCLEEGEPLRTLGR
jgi:PfaB family protein